MCLREPAPFSLPFVLPEDGVAGFVDCSDGEPGFVVVV